MCGGRLGRGGRRGRGGAADDPAGVLRAAQALHRVGVRGPLRAAAQARQPLRR